MKNIFTLFAFILTLYMKGQTQSITTSAGNTCWTNAPVLMDNNLTLTGNSNLSGAIVNFGAGYNSAEDRLIYPTVLFGVTGTFNTATGVLKLTGTATIAQYQQILRSIQYQNVGATPTYGAIKPIHFTLGDVIPFSGTQHFYKFVPAPAITWQNAKLGAESQTYFGMQGYLVTITSAQENAFAFNSIAQNGWIGASDDVVYTEAYSPSGEGQWYWVTGPEKGTRFWQGTYWGGSTVGINYANFGINQPDNGGGVEHYGQFWLNAGFGKWNDLPNYIDASLISGYYVEFGGMPSDPILQTTATKNVQIATKLDFTIPSLVYTSTPPITLMGIPSGGIFKINGNVATQLNPATLGAGTYTMLYEKAGCFLPITKNVTVVESPALATSIGNNCWMNVPIAIDASLTVTGSGNINGGIINFGNGYNSTEDRLIYPTVLFGVTGTFNVATGVLKLTGNATATQYQQILRTIQYQNVGTTPTYGAIKTIHFTLGDVIPFSGTQHFYKFIPAVNISWTNAKAQAEALNYFGLQGYLVTITSAQENTFAFNSIGQQGWIGASDDIAYNGTYSPNGEGAWYWVTGPEKGQQFWQGNGSGSFVGGMYNNWNSGEPNNSGGENFAHFLIDGKWNDFAVNWPSIDGYYVEFGGLPNEPTPQITATKNVQIAENLFFSIPASLCANANPVALTGTPSGGIFKIDGTPASVLNPTLLSEGIHTISYEKAGCFKTATQPIEIKALPTLSFTGLQANYCASASAFALQATPSGGTFTINGTSATQFNPAVLGTGTHTVAYNYIGANGCSNSKTQTVLVNPLPTPTIVNLQTQYCIDTPAVTLQGNPAGGSFTINGASATTFNPNILSAGAHTVVYTYADAQGCSNSASQNVTVEALPALSFVGLNAGYCVSANAFNLQANISGGTFKVNNASSSQFNPATLGVGTHTVTYAYTNANGCMNTISKSVVLNSLPTLIFTNLATSYCLNEAPFALQASPAGGIFKIGGGVTITQFNPQAFGVGSHIVTYTYTNANGCTNNINQTITINPLPILTFHLPDRYCPQATPLELKATPTGGEFTINGIIVTALDPTKFNTGDNVQVTYTYADVNGCVNTATQTVAIIPPDFYQEILVQDTICIAPTKYLSVEALTEADEKLLQAQGHQIYYTWSDNQRTRVATLSPQEGVTKNLTVIVKDEMGCHQRIKNFTITFDCSPNFYVPTAFTPNGDGLNDVLQTFGKDIYNLNFTIYNRWGEVVYTTSDLRKTWDGNIGGKPAPAGVYAWKASYKQSDNSQIIKLMGNVNLIR